MRPERAEPPANDSGGSNERSELGAGGAKPHDHHTACPGAAPAPGATAFLEIFAEARRGVVAQPFHTAVSEGADSPEAVIRWVQSYAIQGIQSQWTTDERRQELRDLLYSTGSDHADAVRFAEHAIEWAKLPPEEKQRRKEERARAGRIAWMNRDPATPAQVRLLRALGFTGDPPQKGDASAMIDRLMVKPRGGDR